MNPAEPLIPRPQEDSPAPSTPSRKPYLFTTEKAREAALLSAAAKRRKREEKEAARDLAHLTARQKMGIAISKLSQEDCDAIVQKMADDAKGGDTKAVHALARWADQSFGRAQEEQLADGRDADEKAWQEMSPAERAAYRAALIAEVRRHESPSQDTTDPRDQDVTK